MSKKTRRGLTRREFAKITGAGAVAAGVGANFLFPQRALAQQKTLKIIQWSHFVPGYDKWFDGVFTKEWGAKNNTNVIVDHIAIGEINARAAAEVAAKKGHDLFMFLAPPAAYEKQVIDHREIVETVQKQHGNVTLNSKNTIEAVKYVRELYKQTMTAEVFSWDPSSNNRGILAKKLSYVANAISVTRSAEKDNPTMSKNIQIRPALRGPVRQIAAEHVMDCYVIWDFAENKDGAKKFLIDYMDSFGAAFKASEFYNFPCF